MQINSVTCAFLYYLYFQKLCVLSPWYNRNGWLGVKHQVTYFFEFLNVQHLLLFTVMWYMFSHVFSFSDEIIILNLECSQVGHKRCRSEGQMAFDLLQTRTRHFSQWIKERQYAEGWLTREEGPRDHARKYHEEERSELKVAGHDGSRLGMSQVLGGQRTLNDDLVAAPVPHTAQAGLQQQAGPRIVGADRIPEDVESILTRQSARWRVTGSLWRDGVHVLFLERLVTTDLLKTCQYHTVKPIMKPATTITQRTLPPHSDTVTTITTRWYNETCHHTVKKWNLPPHSEWYNEPATTQCYNELATIQWYNETNHHTVTH